MSISFEINSVNVDSYVTSQSGVPVIDRNSDYTVILSGFNMSVKYSYPNTISIGQKVELFVDGIAEYKGIIKKITSNDGLKVYQLEIEHGLKEMTRQYVSKSTLQEYLFSLNTVNWNITKTITATAGGSVLDQVYLYVPTGHGLNNYDTVALKIDVVADNVLTGSRWFYAELEAPPGQSDTTKWFKLKNIPEAPYTADYINSNHAQFNGNLLSTDIDLTKYNHYDSVFLPNVNLEHLFDVFAYFTDSTFDYSDLSSYIVYSVSAVDFMFNQICLDVFMLYAVNQSYAMSWEIIEGETNTGNSNNNYSNRRPTLFKIFSNIMSYFGFSLHYKGSDVYEILRPSNSLYSYLPKEYYSGSITKTKTGISDSVFGQESFASRTHYIPAEFGGTGVKTDLDLGYQWDKTLPITLKKNNLNDVKYLSNFQLLLRKNTSDVYSPTGELIVPYYLRIIQACKYIEASIEKDYEVQEIQSPIKTGVNTIKKHLITTDSNGKRSKITQEDEL